MRLYAPLPERDTSPATAAHLYAQLPERDTSPATAAHLYAQLPERDASPATAVHLCAQRQTSEHAGLDLPYPDQRRLNRGKLAVYLRRFSRKAPVSHVYL